MFTEEYYSYVDTLETSGREKDLQRAALEQVQKNVGRPTSAKALLRGGRKP